MGTVAKSRFTGNVRNRDICMNKQMFCRFYSLLQYEFRGRHFADCLKILYERASGKLGDFGKIHNAYSLAISFIYKC